MVPSFTDRYRSIAITPVSGSISISTTWQPFGKVETIASVACETSSVVGTSAGSACAVRSCWARSSRPIARSVPATTNRPRTNSMSAGAVSSTCAAACRPTSITFRLASWIACPLAVIDRDPPVPPPAIS